MRRFISCLQLFYRIDVSTQKLKKKFSPLPLLIFFSKIESHDSSHNSLKLQISKNIVTTYGTLQDDRAQDLPTYSRSHVISCYSSPHIHLLLPHHSRNVHRILFEDRLHCTLAKRADFFTRIANFRKYRNIYVRNNLTKKM